MRRVAGQLSDDELRTLRLISEGMLQYEIAKQQYVSLRTIRNRLIHVRRILGARTTAHAVAIAMRGQLIIHPKGPIDDESLSR